MYHSSNRTLFFVVAIVALLLYGMIDAKASDIHPSYPREELKVSVPGTPTVWAIGLQACGEITGIYFINGRGVPLYVPISLATSTDTRLYLYLNKNKQTNVLDICTTE